LVEIGWQLWAEAISSVRVGALRRCHARVVHLPRAARAAEKARHGACPASHRAGSASTKQDPKSRSNGSDPTFEAVPMRRSITLDGLLAVLANRRLLRRMVGESPPLPPREYAAVSPINLDEFGNLVDGWRRVGGLARWCNENGLVSSRITIEVLVIPAELGKKLLGKPLDDKTVAELITRYWE
jgi:hypothetical protein